jgi:hypothetical protein
MLCIRVYLRLSLFVKLFQNTERLVAPQCPTFSAEVGGGVLNMGPFQLNI